MEELSKKEEGVIDIDNSVVIDGGEGCRGSIMEKNTGKIK